MARPRHEHPTPAELEVLHALWEHGAMTVRQTMETLEHRADRAYTSLMSLMNVMTEKGLLKRSPRGRAFVYAAAVKRDPTLGSMLGDLLTRAFDGSTKLLVTQLLDQANPSDNELAEMRRIIRDYERNERSDSKDSTARGKE
ncbi:MAG: BlaI/MecI/CopY family transcriptional regulator [Phycisphaeraceae bacterium]